jgi:uncharacterized protein YneF (UPF0154 family)
MDTYDSKYIKTWEEYLKDNPEIDKKMAEAMKEKVMASEEMMFNFVIGILL